MKQVALIGCGRLGKRHAANISAVGKLVAVCDTETERADKFASSEQATAYYSIDDLLASEPGVSLVVICTPTGYHAEYIIKTLQAGKDVLCEGPLCLTKAAAWQIIETEKYCKQRVYLIQPTKFYGRHDQTQLFESQSPRTFHFTCAALLTPFFWDSDDSKLFPGGGLLYSPFSSLIDLLLFWFGEILEVEGFVTLPPSGLADDIEDTGAIKLRMQNNVTGTLHWSSLSSQEPILNVLAGTGGNSQAHLTMPDILILQQNPHLPTELIEDLSTRMYKTIYSNLLEALNGKELAFPTSLDGAKTVEAIEKIYKAVR